jgi:hypothetical protein
MKHAYDTKHQDIHFETGQLVLLRETRRQKKLSPKWTGPYKVIAKKSQLNYIIDKEGKELRIHVQHLKPYKPWDPSSMMTRTSNPSNTPVTTTQASTRETTHDVDDTDDAKKKEAHEEKEKADNEETPHKDQPEVEQKKETQQDEPEADKKEQQLFPVEAVIGRRRKDRKWQYQIKWQGYSQPTWEPESQLSTIDSLLRDFDELHPRKRRQHRR